MLISINAHITPSTANTTHMRRRLQTNIKPTSNAYMRFNLHVKLFYTFNNL